MKYIALIVIALSIGCIVFEYSGGADWLIAQAEASTAETTVTVVITEEISSASVTASVPCNEMNCAGEVEKSWWQGVKDWFAVWVF